MTKETAAKIYTLSKESNYDTTLLVLKIIQTLGNENIAEVIKIYEQIKQGKIDIVKVYSSKSLSDKEKQKLETTLIPDFNKPVFLYFVEKELLGGLKVVVDDYVMDESLVTKINKLKLK